MPDEPVARLRPRLVYARGGGWSGALTQARGDTSRPAAMWLAGTGFSSGAPDAGSATTVAQFIIAPQFDEVPAGIGQPPPKVTVHDEWRCASWWEEVPRWWSIAVIDDDMEWPAGAVAHIAAPPNTDPRLSWSMSAHESAAVIRRIAFPWALEVLNMVGSGCSTPYRKDGQLPGHGCQGGGGAP